MTDVRSLDGVGFRLIPLCAVHSVREISLKMRSKSIPHQEERTFPEYQNFGSKTWSYLLTWILSLINIDGEKSPETRRFYVLMPEFPCGIYIYNRCSQQELYSLHCSNSDVPGSNVVTASYAGNCFTQSHCKTFEHPQEMPHICVWDKQKN